MEHARNALLNLEELEIQDLEHIRAEYLKLAEQARGDLREAQVASANS